MNFYKTITNLIKCGLATEEELVQAYAQTGKVLPVPTKEIHTYTDYHKYEDIGSKDYKFYMEVERVIYKKVNSNVE